jgi:hypothetical protein
MGKKVNPATDFSQVSVGRQVVFIPVVKSKTNI